MITLCRDASDDEIRELIVNWSEALAHGEFAAALAMFPMEGKWTAGLLRKTIQGYGVPTHGRALKDMLENWGVDEFRITSIHAVEDVKAFIQQSIEVDRESLYGLSPRQYLGMVHYNNIPLSGQISDLTARFHIKKAGRNKLTLEFLDIHVM